MFKPTLALPAFYFQLMFLLDELWRVPLTVKYA